MEEITVTFFSQFFYSWYMESHQKRLPKTNQVKKILL